MDPNPLVLRNLRLQGSFSHNYPIWERVIHLLDRGTTLPSEIIGLRAPLDGWRGAFDAMHERRVIKSVIVPVQCWSWIEGRVRAETGESAGLTLGPRH